MPRRLTVGALGVLTPTVETGLQNHLLVVEDLHAQVLFDLRTIADQGVSTDALASEAEGISTAIAEIQTDMMTADDTAEDQFHARIAALEAQARDLVSRTATERQRAVEGQQLSGLWWGLGVAAGVGLIAWFVWDQRKRRRR